MLAGQPCYADIAEHLAPLLRGRILVAHNAAFDYAFLAAEARRCGTELPTSVLCTLELAALLDLGLGLGSLRLAALARHWNIPRPARTTPSTTPECWPAALQHALARAAELKITLPIRSPATLPPVEFHEAAVLTARHSAGLVYGLSSTSVLVVVSTPTPATRDCPEPTTRKSAF